MRVETKIKLNAFKPRWYQIELINAIEQERKKRALLVWSRRAGKDHACFYLAVRQLIQKTITCYYVFPTYSQGRKALYDCVNNDGMRILDYLPRELIASKNDQEMKIRLTNNSLFQVIGSDNIDRIVGSNCHLAIFSEAALQSPKAWHFMRPILAANKDSVAIFNSTPRGRNWFYDLHNLAKESDEWFHSFLTANDTLHIDQELLERERAEMPLDLYKQEYECSFTAGVSGAYYARYLEQMQMNNQLTKVPYEPNFPVFTAWDLGMRDSTAIIFFQCVGQTIHIIDCYENDSQGLEHYVRLLQSKPYIYAGHFGPHDLAVRELTTGMSRIEKASELGIDFQVVPNIAIIDGIEAVRSMLPKCWIDEEKCKPLIKSLEFYRREYDDKHDVYRERPLHSKHSHMADALRYLALSLPKTKDGLSAERLEKLYHEATWEDDHYDTSFFKD